MNARVEHPRFFFLCERCSRPYVARPRLSVSETKPGTENELGKVLGLWLFFPLASVSRKESNEITIETTLGLAGASDDTRVNFVSLLRAGETRTFCKENNEEEARREQRKESEREREGGREKQQEENERSVGS